MHYSETNTEMFNADNETRLLSRQWLAEKKQKAVFIAIHGGMAHSGDWEIPALFFREKGISTFALDLRWHGTYPQYNSRGRVFFHIEDYRQNVIDVYNFYSHIRKKHPDMPVFLISHSYGSDIALMFGLMKKETDIKGIIVSSPWLKNRVHVSPVLRSLAGLVSFVYPKFSVKTGNIVEKLTHNKEMIEQHYKDESAGLRGIKATAGTGTEMKKLQNYILNNIEKWDKYPLFGVIAGTDYLADPDVSVSVLKKVPEKLLEMYYYEENFHENFYEANREEIFSNINKWVNIQIKKKRK